MEKRTRELRIWGAYGEEEEKLRGHTHRELAENVRWISLQSYRKNCWAALSRMHIKRFPRRRRGDRVRKVNAQETKVIYIPDIYKALGNPK